MNSQLDQISPVVVQIRIEVPWSKVSENLEGAYRNLQRTARVRGFRPGKVPRQVVKNLLGKSVEREVTTRLMEEGLAEAVKEHALEPVAMSNLDAPGIAEGQPLSFTAKLEVKPKIEAIDVSSLAVQRRVEPITDAEIDEEIDRLREQNAELVTPDSPRPARDGDVLTLKIDVSVEGTQRADLSSDDTRAELGSERLLPEIEAGLQGASVDDEREINVTFPDDIDREPLRGKPAVFKVKVKQLQEKVLPAVDDEFARDLEHESLAALREDIRKRMQQAAEQRADSQVREQVVDKLIDANPIPVPPSLIERQEQAMMGELMQLQQMLGRPLPFDQQMQGQMQQRAERKIRAGLLFGAMAEQQGLGVTDQELEAKLQELADQSGKHVAKLRAEYQGERRESLRSQLLQNKLLEYLLSRATITEAGSETAAGTPGAGESAAERAGSRAKKQKPEDQSKSGGKAESEAKAKPEGKPKSEAKAKPEGKPKTEAKAKPQGKPKSEAKAKPEGKPKSEAKAKTGGQSKSAKPKK